jgi:hypothetical protein
MILWPGPVIRLCKSKEKRIGKNGRLENGEYYALHRVDYLLTWNYRHIDNAETKPLIRRVCQENKYAYPEIYTTQKNMTTI